MLSESSQVQKGNTLQNFRIGKFIQTENRLVVTRAGGKDNGEKLLNGYRVQFGTDGNDLELDRGGGFAQHDEYSKCH